MIHHYIKVAIRQLLKNKLQSAISILGLTIGIFCFLLCNYCNRLFLTNDKFFPTNSHMAEINLRYPEMPEYRTLYDYENIDEICEKIIPLCGNNLETYTVYSTSMPEAIHLEGKKKDTKAKIIYSSADFFKVYPSDIIEGNTDKFCKDEHAAVISEKMAKRLFNKKSPIGQTIEIKRKAWEPETIIRTYHIIAVIKNYPTYLYNNWDWNENEIILRRSNQKVHKNTLLIKPTCNLKRINKIIASQHLQTPKGKKLIAKIKRMPEKTAVPVSELISAIIGLLVISIGVINFASFVLGNFWTRIRELKLRRTLGSNKLQLFIMMLVELTIMMIPIILLLFTLIELIPAFYSMLSYDVANKLPIFESDILFEHSILYLLIIYISLVIIAYISIYINNYRYSKHWFRNILLGIQFTIALFFLFALTSTYIQYRKNDIKEILNISSDDMDRTVFWTTNFNHTLCMHSYEIMQKIKQLSSVECVGEENYNIRRTIESQQYIETFEADTNWLKITGFTDIIPKFRDNNAIAYLISDSKEGNEIKDKTITFMDDSLTRPVYGTINFPITPMTNSTRVLIYKKYYSMVNNALIRLHNKKDVPEFIKQLDEWQNEYLLEGEINEIKRMDDAFRPAETKVQLWLFIFCSITTLLIAILGLYSAITLDTIHRQKEVAIRKINGAKKKDIYWMFGKLYVRLYIITSIVTYVATYIVCNKLQIISQKELLDINDSLSWLITMLLAALIIFVTVAWHIHRISELNPANVIKTE